MTRFSRLVLAAGACAGLAACHNTSTPGAAATVSNTLAFTIDAGPANNDFNAAVASVTVCAPGSTTQCQTIDGVLIDTGSSGLRVLRSALTLQLRQQLAPNGNPIVECAQFVDNFTWGPVQTADLKIGGEAAASVPIQVIDESEFPNIPSACTDSGLTPQDTLDALGANGILGIGLFLQDCGSACSFSGASNPGFYFECPSGGCTVATVPASSQVQNPVSMFAHDNNGVAMTIPLIAPPGAISASGTLIFGIGTQSNNGLGSAQVLTTDGGGNISTSFRGQTYSGSFIDSGSNGFYFLDSATTGIPDCTSNQGFYCPSSSLTLTASNIGLNGRTAAVNWRIDNADAIPNLLNVLPTVGGSNPGSFDWGLPFFFGRTVFTAIEGRSTPGGTGPYFAY